MHRYINLRFLRATVKHNESSIDHITDKIGRSAAIFKRVLDKGDMIKLAIKSGASPIAAKQILTDEDMAYIIALNKGYISKPY